MTEFRKQQDLRWEIQTLTNKTRGGHRTKSARHTKITVISRAMRQYGLQTIHSMKTKHVQRFISDLKEAGAAAFTPGKKSQPASPGTLASYLTVLREIARGIGKENIVARENRAYNANRPNAQRHQPKILDAGKYAQGMERLASKAHGEWMVVAKSTGDVLGMRRAEKLATRDVLVKDEEGRIWATRHGSRELQPLSREQLVARYKTGILKYVDEAKPGIPHAIAEFAKGGLRRLIPLDTVEKVGAMESRQEYIRQRGWTSLMPRTMKPTQAVTAFKNALYRSGFIRAEGSNDHVARHWFIQKEVASGKSTYEVMREAGHSRLEEVRSYVSL